MFCSHHAIFEIVFPLVGVPPPTKICFAEQIAIARILRAIIIIASGMYSCLAGGFLKTHSLEASEGGDSTQHLTTVMFEADNGHFLSVNLTVLLYVEIKCSQ